MSTTVNCYLAQHDPARFATLRESVASVLGYQPTAAPVAAFMQQVTAAAHELCRPFAQSEALLALASSCAQHRLPPAIVSEISAYLAPFPRRRDQRLATFRVTAQALLLSQAAHDALAEATRATSAVPGWEGRTAHHLLVAAEYLAQTAHFLLQGDRPGYLNEKLGRAAYHLRAARDESHTHSLTVPVNTDHAG